MWTKFHQFQEKSGPKFKNCSPNNFLISELLATSNNTAMG